MMEYGGPVSMTSDRARELDKAVARYETAKKAKAEADAEYSKALSVLRKTHDVMERFLASILKDEETSSA